MVNFNPQEEMSLENLLAALQSGLDPNQGYGMLADIIAQQQERAKTRKENMQAYAGALEGTASIYPDRRTAMTQVNAWDTANLVGPRQADTLRDTVRTLYPDGRGTPSPLFNTSSLPVPESTGPMLPETYADVPSIDQINSMNTQYNLPGSPMYTEANDVFDPAAIQEEANRLAAGLVQAGIPVDNLAYYVELSLSQDPEIKQYAALNPGSVSDIAARAATMVSQVSLGTLSGAG